MIGIPGNYDVPAFLRSAFSEVLHARNKRTGRIDNFRRAALEVALDLRCDAVRANDGNSVGVGFVRHVDR